MSDQTTTPERLTCDDCGMTFPYSPAAEVSLPPHGCLQRQREQREARA